MQETEPQLGKQGSAVRSVDTRSLFWGGFLSWLMAHFLFPVEDHQSPLTALAGGKEEWVGEIVLTGARGKQPG